MEPCFDHERLEVYRKARQFNQAVRRRQLLGEVVAMLIGMIRSLEARDRPDMHR
jgi:hypothetical protein